MDNEYGITSYRRMFTTPEFVSTVAKNWNNRKEYQIGMDSESGEPLVFTYLFDGDPNSENPEDAKVIATLCNDRIVVFGSTLASIEIYVARLYDTYEDALAKQSSPVPDPLSPPTVQQEIPAAA